jgi:colanic acid/amylovoran biosynthesis protein
MIIEILGGGTHNKGAELMTQVVLEEVRKQRPDAKFAVNRVFGSYEERGKYGLRTFLPQSGIRSRVASLFMVDSYKNVYGLVGRKDVNAVIDISGFAYGDQWGEQNIARRAAYAENLKRRAVPYILMPQAFGPFTSDAIKESAKKLISSASLAFARENTSLDYIHQLGINIDHVKQAHDFTNLSRCHIPYDCQLHSRYVCIVPNIRMMDKADPSQSKRYIQFMANSIKKAKSAGLEPVYVFHDPHHDKSVAELINQNCSFEIPVVAYDEPQALKGILGGAEIVIGSRFHALVGALCQSVPVIATSWSHKYEELLREYGTPELVVQPVDGFDKAAEAIEYVIDPNSRAKIVENISTAAKKFKSQSVDMMEQTLNAIGIAIQKEQATAKS